jgi:hypothetical protein
MKIYNGWGREGLARHAWILQINWIKWVAYKTKSRRVGVSKYRHWG